MTKKFVLTGAKVFATLKKVFSAGVEYSAEDLGSALQEVDGAGVPYFVEVDSKAIEKEVFGDPVPSAEGAASADPSVVVEEDQKAPAAPQAKAQGKNTIKLGRTAPQEPVVPATDKPDEALGPVVEV